jgi:DNA polymerase III delta subunit
MMGDRRVVVIRDVEAWNKRAKAKAAVLHWLGRPAPETILILVQGGADPERDPDLAAATSHAAAEPLTLDRAKKWLLVQAARLGVVLEDDAATHLVRVTDGGLGLLRSELDKLSGLAGTEPLSLERVSSLLGVRRGETQYDWRDLVLEGHAGRAAALLPHLLSQTGVSGVSLVTLIGTNLIGLGLARAHWDRGLRGGGPLVQAIKSSLFRSRPQRVSFEAAANHWSRLVPSWPPARIERAIKRALEADLRLKNTAVSDERAILFDLVMEISLPWQAAA